jgi:hypothetical protein
MRREVRGSRPRTARSLANACFIVPFFADLVVIARSLYPIPSRTRPSKSSAPMVLSLKAWKSRSLPGLPRKERFNLLIAVFRKQSQRVSAALFCFAPTLQTQPVHLFSRVSGVRPDAAQLVRAVGFTAAGSTVNPGSPKIVRQARARSDDHASTARDPTAFQAGGETPSAARRTAAARYGRRGTTARWCARRTPASSASANAPAADGAQ